MDNAKLADQAKMPILMARELLSETLQEVGNLDGNESLDVEQISSIIGDTLGCLFEAESCNPTSPEFYQKVVSAMEQFQRAFDDLKSAESKGADCASATEKAAKTLAVLYPIVKSVESPSRIPDSPFGLPQEDDGYMEKRTAKRLAIEADIGFQSDTNFFMGFTEDISTGGLFIATYDVRERGSVLTVNFSLPNGHLISAHGIVRWVREYNDSNPDMMPGMGIQFETLSPSDKEAIHRFTEQRAPLFYDE